MSIDFSKSELMVMEALWDGDCLDENGEIQALELSKYLNKKYGWKKTSCYTYLGRLLEKGAITRRYPKYTIKPIVSREKALEEERQEAIDLLFQGSIVNVVQAFLGSENVTKEEIQEMRKLIDSFENSDND